MGSGRWDSNSYISHTTSRGYSRKSTDEIFAKKITQALDPKGIEMRESRDSEDNPESTPIIVGLDVTGSMGYIADTIARQGLNTLCTEIYARKPVPDPHIMVMGIGDLECDGAPLQVSQFEADIRILKQLEDIYLEHGGGGNSYESYTLPWLFAARKTALDSLEKRNKKGYIFTIGDERINPSLGVRNLKSKVGFEVPGTISSADLYAEVITKYNVFHLMVEESNTFKGDETEVVRGWTDILGQHAMRLNNHKKLAEVIVSTIQTMEGMDPDEVAASWDEDTAATIRRATLNLRR